MKKIFEKEVIEREEGFKPTPKNICPMCGIKMIKLNSGCFFCGKCGTKVL